MLRKIMAVVITFILFIGIITPVGYAEVKSSILTKVEIEKLAREKLSLYKDYKLQYSNLYTSDIQQRQFWNLNFEGNKNNTSMVMDAESGVIISINQWYSESYGRAITLLEDDAKKISIDFIKSLETERFKQTEEVTLKSPTIIPFDTKINYTDSDNYHFMFVRKINGEFFPNNYFSVTVSGINGSVISYEMKWDDATYVENKMLLSERRVRDIFGKEDRLKLKYVKLNKYNQQDDKNIILTPVYVYAPKETDKINATNGKLLTFNELYNFGYYGYPIYGDDSFSENEMMDKTASNEVVEMIPEEGVISKEAAEQIIIKMLKEHVNIDGIKLNSTRYTNYYGGIKGKFWSVYWYSNEGSKYLNSVINAENGEVLNISYNKNEGYEPISEMRILEKNVINKENTIKNDDILKIANEKIQTIFPKIKDNLNLEVKSDNIKDEDEVYLSSSRYIDNIPFEDNYVNMRYNTKTKEITSLNYRWYDVEVQNDSSILNEKKAHKIFYDKVGFEKYLVQLKDLEKCKIPIKNNIKFYALVPDFTLSTIESRAVLPKKILFEDATYNVGRTALMIASLVNGDMDLLKVSINDKLHQQYRGPLIFGYDKIMKQLNNLDNKVGAFLSGAGPTIIAIGSEDNIKIINHINQLILELENKWKLKELFIENEGAIIKRRQTINDR